MREGNNTLYKRRGKKSHIIRNRWGSLVVFSSAGKGTHNEVFEGKDSRGRGNLSLQKKEGLLFEQKGENPQNYLYTKKNKEG